MDFLGEATGAFNGYREDENFHPFYYVSEKDMKTAHAFVDNWVGFLKSKKDKVFPGAYHVQLASFLKTKAMPGAVAESYLGITKQVHENPYGDKGLREWPEISPSTVRDKIYLVLKKKAEPLHFEDIAKSINQVG